jgi:hypothetical protein
LAAAHRGQGCLGAAGQLKPARAVTGPPAGDGGAADWRQLADRGGDGYQRLNSDRPISQPLPENSQRTRGFRRGPSESDSRVAAMLAPARWPRTSGVRRSGARSSLQWRAWQHLSEPSLDEPQVAVIDAPHELPGPPHDTVVRHHCERLVVLPCKPLDLRRIIGRDEK